MSAPETQYAACSCADGAHAFAGPWYLSRERAERDARVFPGHVVETTEDPMPNVGDRFTRSSIRPYTEHGERHEHALTLLCEVERVDRDGFAWRTVEILAETGAPTTFSPMRPERGTFAYFGWVAALTRGDARMI